MKPRRRGRVEVFVSYSRQDAELVTPIVALIRTTRRLVFQDLDSLRAGERWHPQIEAAVRAARLVVVFWCDHARSSAYVAEEYQKAISWDKDVVPVLLDPTPLPEDLGAFQAVDFRHLAARLHPPPEGPPSAMERGLSSEPTPAAPPESLRPVLARSVMRRRWLVPVAGVSLGVLLLVSAFLYFRTQSPAPPPYHEFPGSPAPTASPSLVPIVAVVACFAIVAAAAYVLVRRRRRAPPARAESPQDVAAAFVASRLEQELLRRASSPEAGTPT